MSDGWNEQDFGPEETASTNEEVEILTRPVKASKDPVLVGVYAYTKKKTGKMMGDLHVWHLKNPERAVGIWSSTTLDSAMETVPVGALCTVIYDGTRDTGKGSPAHLWTVRFRPAKPGSSAATRQTKGKSDDIAF